MHGNIPARISLPESHAAHLLAHRIVENIHSQKSAPQLDITSVVEKLSGQQTTTPKLIIGIAGAPGAGKTTITAEIHEILTERGIKSAILPQDGFHLSNLQLARQGQSHVKGAPQTFDSAGFVATLHRVKHGQETVYHPVFHREIEESYAADGCITQDVQVVLVEGNYLLSTQSHFAKVRELLHEAWFLEPNEEQRIDRLALRHMRHGRSPEEAIAWALGSDQDNALLVQKTAKNASLIVELN